MGEALVAGMGIQGGAIAYGMHVLGYEVTGVDTNADNLKTAHELLRKLDAPVNLVHRDATDLRLLKSHPDILICALPYHLNFTVAEQCVDRGIRYCDLGGNVPISAGINELAEMLATVPVMTDLGLAPGLANVIAQIGVRQLGGAESVKIRVGGLPVNPKGILKYGLTFSPQGLYNEYHEKCHVLRKGAKSTIDPLTDAEAIHFDGIGELEAFNTSGGLAGTLDSMLKAGVKECSYKTIRYPGHCEMIRFLLVEMKLSKQAFEEGVVNSCGFITDDQVLMVVEVGSGDRSWASHNRVVHDENFTAMQKTTGFGTAAVAAIIGSGKMDGVKAARYADVPEEDFIENVKMLIPELELKW